MCVYIHTHHIHREYLAYEMRIDAPWYDPERVYDDFGMRVCMLLVCMNVCDDFVYECV